MKEWQLVDTLRPICLAVTHTFKKKHSLLKNEKCLGLFYMTYLGRKLKKEIITNFKKRHDIIP